MDPHFFNSGKTGNRLLDSRIWCGWYDEDRERFYGVFFMAHNYIGLSDPKNGTEFGKG